MGEAQTQAFQLSFNRYLRVDIQDHGDLLCVARADGEGQGVGCLAGPAFLRDECDRK